MISKWLADIKERRKLDWIELTSDGFVIHNPRARKALECHWAQIKKVTGYKLDQFTVDCIMFEVETDQGALRISEGCEGFKALEKEMKERLPGFDLDWFGKVAFPPFELCETVLYRREPVSQ